MKSKSIRITTALKQRALLVLEGFKEAYPDARCELDFSTTLELTVAVILSAQCTDKRINIVTPKLFTKYRAAEDWASASQEELEQEIFSTGFYRNKAKNIIALGRELVERFGGEVPNDLDTLASLPGIGRKTANVVLLAGFNKPGISVDTHCRRVSNRLGFTKTQNPEHIESDLKALLPQKQWTSYSHGVIFHGRRCCSSRKPQCQSCPIREYCPSKDEYGTN